MIGFRLIHHVLAKAPCVLHHLALGQEFVSPRWLSWSCWQVFWLTVDSRIQELSYLSSTTDKGSTSCWYAYAKHSIRHYRVSVCSECLGCDKSKHILFDIFLLLLQCQVSHGWNQGDRKINEKEQMWHH